MELAEELMEKARVAAFLSPRTCRAALRLHRNYASYLIKNVQTKESIVTCCKQDLCSKGFMIEDPRTDTDASTKLTALHKHVNQGSLSDRGSNVLKRPILPMAHLVSFEMRIWDSNVLKK